MIELQCCIAWIVRVGLIKISVSIIFKGKKILDLKEAVLLLDIFAITAIRPNFSEYRLTINVESLYLIR
jgi:hypothetical protein